MIIKQLTLTIVSVGFCAITWAHSPSRTTLKAENPPTGSESAESDFLDQHLYIKTNGIDWALLMANISIEADLEQHWTFALPVRYSAWNYFSSTTKFRLFDLRPEFRYWLQPQNTGWYFGLHFGIAYYNFAFNQTYRYQDHNGTRPAVGGGLSLGYRLPLGQNGRWLMEFSIGAGGYSLYYDKFDNVKNGPLTESVKRNYWGLDGAAMSLVYMFNLNKRR